MKAICRVLELNRSSYYAWLKRPVSKRLESNIQLVEKLKVIHTESRGTYGAPRLKEKLKSQGYSCGQKRIAKLMRKAGISGCAKRKYRPGLTYSKHNEENSPRLFEIGKKEALPQAPNQIWVGDITHVPTREGWLYLAVMMDVYSRKVVGYAMADHLRSEIVWDALKAGIVGQEGALSAKEPNLITHTDRGTQYYSEFYRDKLNRLGIVQSMSRPGNCYDNAYAESFFHTLKVELVYRQDFKTRVQATNAVQDYIDNWYNGKRLHSGLGYQTPLDYERRALAA